MNQQGRLVTWFLSLLLFGGGAGCSGYRIQGTENPLLQEEGINRVYVRPIVNNTFKAGAENVIYNAVIKRIATHRVLKLVANEKLADAVIEGVVQSASYSVGSETTTDNLFPQDLGTSAEVRVATGYNAVLSCEFRLIRNRKHKKHHVVGELIWSGGFTRGRPFAASNQLSSLGTTSALINESEFDRALSEMATSMAGDLHESMLTLF